MASRFVALQYYFITNNMRVADNNSNTYEGVDYLSGKVVMGMHENKKIIHKIMNVYRGKY